MKVYVITCEHADRSKVTMAVKKSRKAALGHLNWLLDWRYQQWKWVVIHDVAELPKKDRHHSVGGKVQVRRVLVGNPENRTRYSEWLEIEEWEVTNDVPTVQS